MNLESWIWVANILVTMAGWIVSIRLIILLRHVDKRDRTARLALENVAHDLIEKALLDAIRPTKEDQDLRPG